MITIKKQTNTNFDNIPTNASKCMPREIFKIKRLHPKDKKTYKDTHTQTKTRTLGKMTLGQTKNMNRHLIY